MNGFWRNNHFYKVAYSLDQLSFQQLFEILSILSGAGNILEKRKRIAKKLLKVRFSICWLYPFFIPGENEWYDLQSLADFVFDKPKHKLRSNKLKKVGKLYAPPASLGYIKVIEWIKLNHYHKLYVQTRKEVFLHHLIAVLYRLKKSCLIRTLEKLQLFGYEYQADKREKYSDATLEKRVKKIAQWHPIHKQMVWMYWIGAMETISKANPQIFTPPKEESQSQKLGWEDTLFEIAELKNCDLESIADWSLDGLLFYLNKSIDKKIRTELQNKL